MNVKTVEPKIIDDFIPYCQHSISNAEVAEVLDTLQSNWLTKGPKTLQFEAALAEYIGCKHVVAVSSCTAALHLALRVYDLQPGDEVITTPMTFVATAEVCEYIGVKPVFVDINPADFNIDPGKIESAITEKTKAIMPVHYGGIPCDLQAIYDIAKAHGLQVIEDAAHAIGTTYRGGKIGSHGSLTAFSFYPTKNMTTGEGGAIATNDDEIANRLRVLSLHGISKDAWKRYSSEGQWFYEISELGYKYNFTDLQAAIGLHQLKQLDDFNRRREELAKTYYRGLSDIPGIEFPQYYHDYFSGKTAPDDYNCWHLMVMMVDTNRLSIDRNQFIELLKAKNIGTSVHFIPLHIQPYYANKYGYQPEDYPIAYDIYQKIISIPLYPKMTNEQVEYVIDHIRSIANTYKI
jgi:dTDP-4-amino-4,6-dideoxygalactose transaminase